jgi:RimJ/RimL family protein N-acetyltransferase
MMVKAIVHQELVLENERVRLQPLAASDFHHLLPFALNEPELWRHSLVSASGETGLQNYIAAALQGRQAGTQYPFIVFDKQQQQYAGSTRFYDIQPSIAASQLGYTWYGKSFQRTGLNRHCKFLLLSYAFDQWGLERVEFRASVKNKASIAAMKAIGCTEEGILRNNRPLPDGQFDNSIVLSILKAEWQGSIRQELYKRIRKADEKFTFH